MSFYIAFTDNEKAALKALECQGIQAADIRVPITYTRDAREGSSFAKRGKLAVRKGVIQDTISSNLFTAGMRGGLFGNLEREKS